MIFTDCIYNYNKVSKDTRVIQICVMRYKPACINIMKSRMIQYADLSPSSKLLLDYKRGKISCDKFKFNFLKELKTNSKVIDILNNIIRWHKLDYIVILYCCEESDSKCHRKILRELLQLLTNESYNEMEELDYERCNTTK